MHINGCGRAGTGDSFSYQDIQRKITLTHFSGLVRANRIWDSWGMGAVGAATTVGPSGQPLGVADLARDASDLPLSEFVVRHGRWFLVRQANPDDPASAGEAMILPVRSTPQNAGRPTPLTLGSDPACDMRLDDPSVAAIHARLFDRHEPLEWPTLHVECDVSTDGLSVDRLDVEPGVRAQLFNGTRLRLGPCELDVVSALAMQAWLRRYA